MMSQQRENINKKTGIIKKEASRNLRVEKYSSKKFTTGAKCKQKFQLTEIRIKRTGQLRLSGLVNRKKKECKEMNSASEIYRTL